MTDSATFSIVVPVYKVEAFLDRCVQSLIKQTYTNIEIILVDDGSPDQCPLMCDAYAEADMRVRVIHKENGGLSDARNVGIEAARGEYILFVDSDDYISLDTCEKILPFTSQKCDIIVGDGVTEGGMTRLKHHIHNTETVFTGAEYLKAAFATGAMPMAAWLYIYRRDYLQMNGLFFKRGILHEDEQFTPRSFLLAERVMDSGVCFYHYVCREGSITKQKDRRKNAIDLYNTCLELKNIYEKLSDHELKINLLDSLVVKYLTLFQSAQLFRYGKTYLRKDFICANAYKRKTKMKAWLYCISPRLYWHINNWSKHR